MARVVSSCAWHCGCSGRCGSRVLSTMEASEREEEESTLFESKSRAGTVSGRRVFPMAVVAIALSLSACASRGPSPEELASRRAEEAASRAEAAATQASDAANRAEMAADRAEAIFRKHMRK